MNKKKIGMFMFLIVSTLGLATALIVTSNGYLLDRNEMASIQDSDIANYMLNTFSIADYKIMEDRIIIYYNITYVEPSAGFNSETNESETQYKVFTQMKPFIIDKSLWNTCTNITDASTCVEVLVNYPEPFDYNVTENETIHIESTYYKATQEQLRQYYRAIEVRDNAIDNELDYLFSALG